MMTEKNIDIIQSLYIDDEKNSLTVHLVSCFHFIIKEEANQNEHTTEVSENCRNERANNKIGKISIINSFDLIFIYNI